MKGSFKKKQEKKKVTEVTTFAVPFTPGGIKENINITTNTHSKTSKEEIIKQAINFHLQGDISKAAKHYQYCINEGFSDHRVFSNFGAILQGFGKLQEAELLTRKAIKLSPNFATAHSNLGNILSDLGKSQEAELSQRKAIELNPNFANAYANLGEILSNLGKLQEAELSQRKAIELNPDFSDAHLNLGLILRNLGNLRQAELSTCKAIELNPNFANAHLNLGIILKDLGNLQQAELSTRKAIELNPNFANAHLNLGIILKDLGNLQQAELSTRKAIELNPNLANAHLNLGNILKDLGNLQQAEISYRKAIELNPDSDTAHLNLGTILKDLGDLQQAEESTRKAIQLNPDYDTAHLNLGTILKELGNLQKAEESTRKAIELNPNLAEAHSNLGNVLREIGHLKEAEESTRKAIEIKPNFAEAYSNLGTILRALKNTKEAELYIRKAININPNLASAYYNLGNNLYEIGDFKDAKILFDKALENEPNNLAYYFSSKLFLSPIPFSKEQISIERDRFRKNVLSMRNKSFTLYNNFNFNNHIFYLAFHGIDDSKEILNELACALSEKDKVINNSFDKEKQIESFNKRNRIRLGICSEYLYSHSVNYFFGNIIRDLASSGIEIIIFRGPNSKHDEQSKSLDLLVSKSINLPNNFQEACKVILNESIDILLYPEIGMSNFTYFLSLSRLALVQVNALGHSDTSGSPNIDYAISCDDYDLKGSEKHLTEKVIRLSRLPVNFKKPVLQKSSFKRSDLNLPEKAFLIGLPHTSFKFHPDFDFILDKILEEIPNAYFHCAEGTTKSMTKSLKERWEFNTKLLLKRTIFYSRVSSNDFLSILKSADIILAPFYFGMGNTFYQAMSVGTPVVSYPTDIFRTRHPYAGYRQMEITNPPIAYSPEEFISIVKKLAFDKSYKEDIKNQIISKSNASLFNDKTIYKEYIQFFKASIEASKKNISLPNHWQPKRT